MSPGVREDNLLPKGAPPHGCHRDWCQRSHICTSAASRGHGGRARGMPCTVTAPLRDRSRLPRRHPPAPLPGSGSPGDCTHLGRSCIRQALESRRPPDTRCWARGNGCLPQDEPPRSALTLSPSHPASSGSANLARIICEMHGDSDRFSPFSLSLLGPQPPLPWPGQEQSGMQWTFKGPN